MSSLCHVCVSGVSPEGISLLQRWVENTGDVQSAALLAARCATPELLRDPRVLHWLDRSVTGHTHLLIHGPSYPRGH